MFHLNVRLHKPDVFLFQYISYFYSTVITSICQIQICKKNKKIGSSTLFDGFEHITKIPQWNTVIAFAVSPQFNRKRPPDLYGSYRERGQIVDIFPKRWTIKSRTGYSFGRNTRNGRGLSGRGKTTLKPYQIAVFRHFHAEISSEWFIFTTNLQFLL